MSNAEVADVINTELEARREREIAAQHAELTRKEGIARRFRPRPARDYNRVGANLVVRLVLRGETKGGILLPDESKEIPGHGRVVAAGEGSAYRVGDHVLFSIHCGCTMEFQDGERAKEFRVLSDDEVYGAWDDVGLADQNVLNGEGKDAAAACAGSGPAGSTNDGPGFP